MTDPTPTIPQLDYQNPLHQPPKPSTSWSKPLVWTLGAIGAVALLISCLLPSLGRAREPANRVKCGSNLRQIGQAAFLYANAHGGLLPPDLPTLLQEDITPEVFVCPSGDHDKATGATTQAVVASMLAGDHLSYAWAGSGMNVNNPAFAKATDIVLAFDLDRHVPRDNARDTGINVLLSNGSVTFIDESVAKSIRAQFAAGIRPVRLPPTPGTPSPPGSAK